MLVLKKNAISMEMELHDLWEIGIALKNGIQCSAKSTLIQQYHGDSVTQFINYVKQESHPIYQYVILIFSFLQREDVISEIDAQLHQIYFDARKKHET